MIPKRPKFPVDCLTVMDDPEVEETIMARGGHIADDASGDES